MNSRPVSRTLSSLLVYAAVLVRVLPGYEETPSIALVIGLLSAYGLLFPVELWCSRSLPERLRVTGLRAVLALRTGLALMLVWLLPELDFLPLLFIPLSVDAVLLFSRRIGLIWIVGFVMIIASPMMEAWNGAITGVAMIVLYAAVYGMGGLYAHLLRQAEGAQQENRRLLNELSQAHRQLQDYAAEVEGAAAARERSHMARELHDSATQTIFSMTLEVQAAALVLGKHDGRLAQQLSRIEALAQSANAEIRALIDHLRPRPWTAEDLEAALQRLVTERQTRDGMVIRLEVSHGAPLGEAQAAGLYRIAQEALTNVARHAGPCTTVVRLDLSGAPAYLEISDDGIGFDVSQALQAAGHYGLAGMRDRALSLGWQLIVDSRAGSGTRLRVVEA